MAASASILGIIYHSGDMVFISGNALAECVTFFTDGEEFFAHVRVYAMRSRLTPHSARWRPSGRYEACSMRHAQLAYAWYADGGDLVAIAA